MRPDVLADADEAAARAAKAAGVAVRELESLAELEAMTALFDEIWEPDAGNPSLRVDLLRALTKAGNYASGAYDVASGELLGACIGFFGPPSHAELHSHIAGVRAAGLGRAVGFALKVHQRAWCLRRDTRVIAWTYDPLIRRNAYFNLVKLGARPVEYLRNFYGVMDDVINGGTETDRMLVHWDLRSDVVAEACAGRPYELYREIFAELAGVEMPAAIEPPAEPVEADITPHLGRYERAGVLIEVLAGPSKTSTEKTEGPTLRTTVTGPIAELMPDPVEEYAMIPAGPDRWLVREPGPGVVGIRQDAQESSLADRVAVVPDEPLPVPAEADPADAPGVAERVLVR